ncbi:MAG: hypothetical protein WD491_11430 [Balneolales bacterium]
MPIFSNSNICSANHGYNVLQVTPIDTSYTDLQTDVRMTYNDEYLYLIAESYRTEPSLNVVQSLRQDFNFGTNDNFLVFIDTPLYNLNS